LIGAGEIGLQKIRAFLDSGAQVHVVAPEALPEIEALAQEGRVRWSKRGYETADLDGVTLVIAATDDPALQQRIAAESRERRIWVNIVDVPPLCDFIAPAIVRRGDIQVAISTGGAAPALAKFLRQKVEQVLGPEYADFVQMVKQYRPDILKLPKPQRMDLWNRMVNDDFMAQIRRDGIAPAEARLKEWIYGKRE